MGVKYSVAFAWGEADLPGAINRAMLRLFNDGCRRFRTIPMPPRASEDDEIWPKSSILKYRTDYLVMGWPN
jgi:hypothetical protein